jgi:hypothetical protein
MSRARHAAVASRRPLPVVTITVLIALGLAALVAAMPNGIAGTAKAAEAPAAEQPSAEMPEMSVAEHAAMTTAARTSGSQSTQPADPGCKAGEIAVDAQDWWLPTDGQRGNNFGHVHVSTCFPHMKRLGPNERVELTIKTTMHHNPGVFRRLMVQMVDDGKSGAAKKECGGDSFGVDCTDFNRTCPNLGTCSWTDKLSFGSRDVPNAGWKQIRIRAFVGQDGNRDGKVRDEDMRTSTGLQVFVNDPGKRRKDTGVFSDDPNFVEARGWFTKANYANARLWAPPTGAVKGIWEPTVQMRHGADGATVTSWYAAIDTDFHGGKAGLELCPGNARASGESTNCGPGEFKKGKLRIDTTKLANGYHRLFLKTNQKIGSKDSTNSGVLAFIFKVQN